MNDRTLLGIAVLLVLAFIAETFWPHPLESSARPMVATPDTPAPGSPDAVPFVSRTEYRNIVDHPLFTPDRRPYRTVVEAPVERTQPAPAPPPDFRLSAVIETPDARIALLRDERSSNIVRLTVGEHIDGWTLVEIRPNAVVLKQDAAIVTVEMQPEKKGNSA